MKFFLCLLLLGSAISMRKHRIVKSGFFEGTGSGQDSPVTEIYGGQEADLGDFPYQAFVSSIYTGLGTYICGGVLISEDYVLTAAHCVKDANDLEVILGALNRQDETEPSRVSLLLDGSVATVHEYYHRPSIDNDIALIKLDPPVIYTANIQAIALTPSEPPVGTYVTLSGWGRTGDTIDTGVADILNWAKVPIADDLLCEDFYIGDQHMWNTLCLDTYLSGTSPCGGDSGGPMTYNLSGISVVAGVTSWGSEAGCSFGAPIGYVSVTSYLDWIANHTGITP